MLVKKMSFYTSGSLPPHDDHILCLQTGRLGHFLPCALYHHLTQWSKLKIPIESCDCLGKGNLERDQQFFFRLQLRGTLQVVPITSMDIFSGQSALPDGLFSLSLSSFY